MKFDGQSQSGYAMAALLVALSVMAVLMTVVMPVWRQAAQREKEDELVFRGLQYAHAIGLYERKYANTPPPTLDVLTQERFLRKKYRDPITNAEFVVIPGSQAQSATPGAGTTPAAFGRAAAIQTPAASRTPAPSGAPAASGALAAGRGGATGGVTSGVIGVTSASTSRSIRIYNGGTHYNEWRFVYAPPTAAPGTGGTPGTGGLAGRGAPARPGQPGQPNGAPGGPNGPGRGQPQGGPNRGAGPGAGGQRGGPQSPTSGFGRR
jgi:type II secretory pathway pseudopilin PulG